MRFLAIVFFLAFVTVGCQEKPKPDPAPKKESPMVLQFEDKYTGKLFNALKAHMEEKAKGWKHVPWGKGGNFYRAKWARGAGARDDCVIASGSANVEDQHCIELYTLFYPKTFPKVFGLGIHVLLRPKGGGWGVNLYLSRQGKTIVGEGFSIDFNKYSADKKEPILKLNLGRRVEYKIKATTVHVTSTNSPLTEMRRYLKSPADFKNCALEQLMALEKKVEETLQSHKAQAMEYGPYEGGGIPPEEIPRPLTEAEEKEEQALAKAHFAKERQIIIKEHKAMFDVIKSALPFFDELLAQ